MNQSWLVPEKERKFRFDARLRRHDFSAPKRKTMAAAAINNRMIYRPKRNDEHPEFERLLRRLDNEHDRYFVGDVWLGPFVSFVLSDHGAQRLGRSLLRAKANGCRISRIKICPYYMTADAGQYSALLDFFAIGQYYVVLENPNPEWPAPGMRSAMEHLLAAMLTNRQLAAAEVEIQGASLRMQTLHLVLQCPRLTINGCRMAVLPNDTTDENPAASTAALRISPERSSTLHLSFENDWFGILQAATMLETPNVASLHLYFWDAIVGRLDLSSLMGFITTQPNSVDLNLAFFPSSRMDGDAIVEHVIADILTQCPGVHGLVIHVDYAMSPLICARFPRLMKLVSDSTLTRLVIKHLTSVWCPVLYRTQEQQIAVLTKRNSVIPVYLQTTKLLKQGRSPISSYEVYADDGKDRPKHQFVLSHALSQAAVHPIFFSHVYEYVREHVDQLFGGGPVEDQQQQPHNRRFDDNWCSMM
jgi:hypothetical protein